MTVEYHISIINVSFKYTSMEMPVVEVRDYGVWLLAKNVSNLWRLKFMLYCVIEEVLFYKFMLYLLLVSVA